MMIAGEVLFSPVGVTKSKKTENGGINAVSRILGCRLPG